MEIKKKMIKKTAIILCGGKGTRLGKLGKKLPKTLVRIQNKEILWYIIKLLKKNGFNQIILPTGYKEKFIKRFLIKNKFFDLEIKSIFTGQNTNIGKRIYKIINEISSENFLLLNGDAIFSLNLRSIFNQHVKNKIDLTFLSSETTYPYGTIGTRNGKIVDFKRNLIYDKLSVRNHNDYLAYNYTGMALIKKKILIKFKKSFKNSDNFEQFFFPKVIKSYKTNVLKIRGFWHSIDNIKDLEMVDKKNINKIKFKSTKKLKKTLQ
jgi:glucose-1-phosphate cytidylyltransferase